MNKVILMGRLTRDPEIRYGQGDNAMAIARFTLAVDRRFKRDGDAQTADFISCVAFGKTAEYIQQMLLLRMLNLQRARQTVVRADTFRQPDQSL